MADLEPESIDNAIKNGTLIRFHNKESTFLYQMNGFLGNRYNMSQIDEMLDESKVYINHESQLYQELFKSAKYLFVTYYINETYKNGEKFIPILCEYTGNDTNIGEAHFKHLVQLKREYTNMIFDLVYMRYSNHFLISYETEDGINAMRNMML